MAKEAPTETGARLREVYRDRQKESWKEELQEIERKRTELLPGAPEDAEKVSEAAEFAGQEEELPQGRW